MQESVINKFPFEDIVPCELETCVFLMMLQYFVSYFGPDFAKQMQLCLVAMLSTKEVYKNEHVTELESVKGAT
jgi:hypothetical protein